MNERAFWLFWASLATSSVGTAVTTVALPVLALNTLDASAFQVSLLVGAADVGWLVLGLPAGVIAQRLETRFLQVTMDLIRAAALLSIPVAWWLGALTIWQLLVVSLVVGFATVLFYVANAAYLPQIVDRETLISRNSWISGTLAVADTGGPSIGGAIVQLLGAITAVVVDAISYLVSAVLLAVLPRSAPARQEPGERADRVISTGLSWIRRHPVMFPSVQWAVVTNFVAGAVAVLIPVYLVRNLDAPPLVLGVVLSAAGVGAFLGAGVATRVAQRWGTARALVGTSVLSTAALFLLPLSATPALIPFFAFGNLFANLGIAVGSIVTRTHRQTDSPADMLPMVMAGVRFFSWGAIPLGAVSAGAVASTPLGARGALWYTCVVYLAAPLVLWFSPVRGRRDLSDEAVADR